MKRSFMAVALLWACWLWLQPAALAQAGQQPVVLKLGTLAPEGTIFYDALLKMANEWLRVSNGAVQLKIYAGGIAGTEHDMVRKIRIGQLHAATISAIGMMQIDSSYAALQVPGMIASYEELDYCRERLAPLLEQRFAERGFIIANYADLGYMYFFTSQKTGTIAELQKKKICTFAGDQTSREIWAKAGFNAVDIPLSEMLTALQTGLIDGFLDTPVFALSLQIFSKAKHMINVHYGIAVASTIIQKSQWDKVNPELQAALLQAAAEVSREVKAEVRSMAEKAIAEMKKYGLEPMDVAPQDVPVWLEPVHKIYPEIRAKLISQDIFDKTLQLRSEFRALKQ